MSATMSDRAPNAGDTAFFGHPRGLSTLFFTEMWERFSYYGMRALLFPYMTTSAAQGGFGLEKTRAGLYYGLYTASVYMLPLVGGWLADNLLGARLAVFIGGIIIMCGHISLAIDSPTNFYLGLALVAVGTGFLKANISAMVGNLYTPEDARRDAGFSIFYMGINLGGLLAPLVCDFLRVKWDWHYGFGAAAVGMGLGLIQYIVGRGNLVGIGDPPPRKTATASDAPATNPLFIVVGAVLVLAAIGVAYQFGLEYLLPGLTAAALIIVVLIGAQAGLNAAEWRQLAVIGVLFTFSTLFWMGFEQAGTSLNLFAKELTDNKILGFTFPSGWFQSVNSIFIVAFAPVFAAIWLKMGRRQPSDTVKFALGLLFLGLGFLVMIAAASQVASGRVSPMWLLLFYLCATFGELCLSPVGLSAMTKLAPAKMVGLMLGVWFLSISLGNYFAGVLGGEFEPTAPALVGLFGKVAAIALVGGVLLLALSPLVKRLTPTER